MTAFVPSKSWLNFPDYYSMDGIEFFDTPDFPVFPTSKNDQIITIDQKYLGRLDMIANDYYNDVNLWWVIALVNNIELIPESMFIGMTLVIPAQDSVSAYLTKAGKK
jgi:hypothetical protein